jgi:hypothetical protein
MTGKVKSFKAKVHEVNPEIRFHHCFLHREATGAELRTFLISHTLLSDESWVAKLAYLLDIFCHLNELNRKMQGKDETIFSTTDKIEGFRGKLKLFGIP